MQFFFDKNSVVRKIWGKSDTVLFIFAGASAEFALNKAVDWLYFTGKLPSDPLGRLFSTISYARKIVFAPMDDAHKTIDSLTLIHAAVEKARGFSIPDWAYRDVLYMLMHYSIASYELLEKKLTEEEKEEVFNVFFRFGTRMGLKDLPTTYIKWLPLRNAGLRDDLQMSKFTTDLFRQYKKQLGPLRYFLLIESQKLVVPERVRELLNTSKLSFLTVLVPLYKISRRVKIDRLLKSFLYPSSYRSQINELDMSPKI